MLEVLIIFSIVYACMLMPLRGKTFEELTAAQKQRVDKYYYRYMRTRKGRKTPVSITEYLPILQKQALVYLIMAICLVPLYIIILIFVYPMVLAGL